MSYASDTENAQLRSTLQRGSEDAKAAEAQRFLDDPAYKRALDAVREGLVNALENIKHDGQAETDAMEREICRSLRTLNSVNRALHLAGQGHKLRLADFKALASESDERTK